MEPENDYPDFVARFYDTIYGPLRSGTDAEFYLKRIAQAKGPVLELGTGTGRLFVEALNRGADIVGIDNSPAMVKVLLPKLRPADHTRVMVMDARRLSLARRFSLILAPFRVFSHLLKVEDQLAVLNKVCDHLQPGGRFLFDVFAPNLKYLQEGLSGLVDFEGEYQPGRRLKRTNFMTADPVNQLSRVRMVFEWEEGGRLLKRDWSFTLRFFFRYELEHLVRLSRLKLEALYGDFAGGPPGPESKEFVVLCRKE
jgi:SAM-dependent methyltransferase